MLLKHIITYICTKQQSNVCFLLVTDKYDKENINVYTRSL
jgi:hypothetical protein